MKKERRMRSAQTYNNLLIFNTLPVKYLIAILYSANIIAYITK